MEPAARRVDRPGRRAVLPAVDAAALAGRTHLMTGGARICIVTGSSLARNPRVVKEASALAAAGHEVTVLGPAFSERLADEDAALARTGGWQHRIVVDMRAAVPG